MVKTAQTKSPIFRNLNGGLNVREAVTAIGDAELVMASNIDYYTTGALVRRGGWVPLIANSPFAKPLKGLFQAGFVNNTTGIYSYVLVITDGITMWATANPTATPVVWTEITNGQFLDASQPWKFVMMAGYMVAFNGVAGPFLWNGNFSSGLIAVPNTYYAAQIGDIIFASVGNVQGITIVYTSGATAGSEVVTVSTDAISVKIADGVSTANQIITAIAASGAAAALVVGTTTNGTGVQAVADASTAVALAPVITPPASRMGIVWQNYLFFAGGVQAGVGYPNRLFFSDLGTPVIFPQSNFIDVDNPFDADPITGLVILYGNLIVLKRFSIFILQGSPPDNLILTRLNSSVGCINPESVVAVDNLFYFLSDKGLYQGNLFNTKQACYKVEPRYTTAIPYSSPANPIYCLNYYPRGQIFSSINAQILYNSAPPAQNDRIMVHDYFNADQNGDPIVSEFVAGYTAFGLAATKTHPPTAPSIMAQWISSSGSRSLIATFYDQWVYVFQDGALGAGGPADSLSWMSAPIYPPSDALSKFYDLGDPDMIKIPRWLWTTGQNYNNIGLQAGIVLNDSPTASTFVNYNYYPVVLTDSGGGLWDLLVDDDGAIRTTKVTSATGAVTFLNLEDESGGVWNVVVLPNGTLNVVKTAASANTPPVLVSPGGYQYQLLAVPSGALDTELLYTPDLTTIIPGRRVFVPPTVNGITYNKMGKYVQFYFKNIGILTQFSADIILKGRRN